MAAARRRRVDAVLDHTACFSCNDRPRMQCQWAIRVAVPDRAGREPRPVILPADSEGRESRFSSQIPALVPQHQAAAHTIQTAKYKCFKVQIVFS